MASPDYPGERLIVFRNPLLASRRTWNGEELLASTGKALDTIVAAPIRVKRPFKGQDKIGLRVGKRVDKYHVGKHFDLEITGTSFAYRRREEKIREEAALDGLDVIRTSSPPRRTSGASIRSHKSNGPLEASRPLTSRSGPSIIVFSTG